MRKLSFFFALLLCSILVFTSFGRVSATEVETQPDFGWLEAKCEIPDGFDDNVGVILLNEETDETYTVTCRKVNDYIGRTQLPAGPYVVLQTYTGHEDNFAYGVYPDVYYFTIRDDASAAQQLILTVEETVMPDPTETEPEPETEPQEPSEDEPEVNASDPSDPSGPEATEGDTDSQDSSADTDEKISGADLLNGFLYGLGAFVIFVLIAFLCAFLYRRHINKV